MGPRVDTNGFTSVVRESVLDTPVSILGGFGVSEETIGVLRRMSAVDGAKGNADYGSSTLTLGGVLR